MTGRLETNSCRLLGVSVTGAGHDRHGQPCQDALAWRPTERHGLPACLAVADGHGSAASFRSAFGSRFAVESVIEVISQFLESYRDSPASLIKRTAEERLPLEIVRAWRERVGVHRSEHPYDETELQNPEVAAKVSGNPLLAYGTTILAVGVIESAIIYLQLGDGDILAVGHAGEVFSPLARDERNFGDETTSLCLPEAARDFRFGFQSTAGGLPALILLSTDGYSNCFPSDEEFRKVGPDLLASIESLGPEQVEQQLAGHLAQASRNFSGDDITLGMVWFPQADARKTNDQAP